MAWKRILFTYRLITHDQYSLCGIVHLFNTCKNMAVMEQLRYAYDIPTLLQPVELYTSCHELKWPDAVFHL
jgi:hypothetical protein